MDPVVTPDAPAVADAPAVKKRVTPSGAEIRTRLLSAKAREQWVDVENPETGELEQYLLVSPQRAPSEQDPPEGHADAEGQVP
jgi:hypothetical protein